MAIIMKHILRNIRENKFRSILIVFSLAVSTMVLFLNLTIKDDIGSIYRSVLKGAYQEYDMEVYHKEDQDNDSSYDSSTLNYDGLDVENTFDMQYATGLYENKGEDIDVQFVACDRTKLVDTKLCDITEKTDDFDVNNKSQVIMSKKTAKKYGIKLGDLISVDTKKGVKQFQVAALSEQRGMFIFEQEAIFIFTDVQTGYELTDSKGVYCTYIDLKNNANSKDAVETFKDNNKDYVASLTVDEDSIESALNQINQMLMIVLVAVVILNFYVISSITKLIMATRLPVVGTFRSLGATKRKMNIILLSESITYGVIGSIFGIIFGILLRKPISNLFISTGDMLDYVQVNYSIKPSYIIIAVGFSVILEVLISLSSILKTSKKPIKDVIFNTLSTSAKVSKKKSIIGVVLFILSIVFYMINDGYNMAYGGLGIVCAIAGTVLLIPILIIGFSKVLSAFNKKVFGPAAELGTKTLHKSKTTRSSIVLVTVSIAITMLIYLTILATADIFTQARDSFDCDVLISGLEEEESYYSFVNEIDGVDNTSYTYDYWSTFSLNGGDEDTAICVYGAEKFDNGITGDDSILKNLADNEIMVDSYFAKKNNIKVGDKITLDRENMMVHNREYTVKALINSSKYTTMRNLMIVNRNEYKNSYTKIPSEIQVKSNKDADDMKQILRKEFAGSNVYIQTQEEFISQQESQINGILGMIQAMLGLSVVLSILGILNNQVIGFIQKKKEYAVLYSTAMSKSQLRKMVLFEVLGTFVCGCTIGTALTIWLTRILEQVLTAIGICINISIRWQQLGVTLLIVFVILSLTAISPIRKISKIKVVDEIKYE